MNNLDKLFKEKREQFDAVEPLDGHFERFGERLGLAVKQTPASPARFRLLKVAAIILILITGSVAVFDLATRSIRDRFSSGREALGMDKEFAEASRYYDNKAMAQLTEVRRLTSDPMQANMINESAMKEMVALDENTAELRKSLAQNPNCERLQAAFIQNQQMKEGVMNTIVSHLNKH